MRVWARTLFRWSPSPGLRHSSVVAVQVCRCPICPTIPHSLHHLPLCTSLSCTAVLNVLHCFVKVYLALGLGLRVAMLTHMCCGSKLFHAWLVTRHVVSSVLCLGLGREAPGKAYRLYTEQAYMSLEVASAPEIQRVNLASLVLQLKQLGVANLPGFAFMDPPSTAALMRALELLLALGALDAEGGLSSPLGTRMVRLPVEPVFAKVSLISDGHKGNFVCQSWLRSDQFSGLPLQSYNYCMYGKVLTCVTY